MTIVNNQEKNLLKIKVELLHNDQNQSQVETDENNSSEDDSTHKKCQKMSKKIKTEEGGTKSKRNSSSELISKSKRTKLNEDIMVVSNSSVIPSTSNVTNRDPLKEYDEVAKLKRLINDLSNESIKDPKNVRNKLESIIGKEAVSALSSILVDSPKSKDGNANNIAIESFESEGGKRDHACIETQSNKDESNSIDERSDDLLSRLSSGRGTKSERKQKGRKSEVDKLNEDIADSFICNEVVAARGPRLKMRKQYAEDDLIQDELYDCEYSNYSKTEESEEDFDRSQNNNTQNCELNAVNLNASVQNHLKKCYVAVTRLNTEGLKMPVTILKDGSIDRSLIENVELKHVLSSLDEPQKNQNVSGAASVDTSLYEREQVITIEDDDNISERNLQNSETLTKSVHHLNRQEKEISLLSPSSKVVALSDNKVSNLSFVQCRNGIKLKCCTEKCNYECNYESHEQIFKYHIQTQHILSKWCGSCKLCDSSVSDFGSLLDEYNHMNDVHIKRDTSAFSNGTTNSDGTEEISKKHGKRKKEPSGNIDIITSINAKASNDKQNASIYNSEVYRKSVQLRKDIIRVSREVSNDLTETDQKLVINSQSRYTAIEGLSLGPLQCNEALSQLGSTNYTLKNLTVQKSSPISATSNYVTLPPTIKLRVLPGDKLSSVNTQAVNLFQSPRNAFLPSINKLVVAVPKTSMTSMTISDPPIPTVQIGNERLTVSLNGLKTFKVYIPNSTNCNQQSSIQPSTSSTNNTFVISSVSSLVPPEVVTPAVETKALTIVPSPMQKRLRPWLLVGDLKHTQNISRMLTTECLRDMYKCMGSVCNFHSNDVTDFLSHLKWHEACQITDSNHYRRCCYCSFTSEGIIRLTEHIQEIHKYDKYACTKCFYRSVNEIYVYNHQSYHHKDLSRKLIECQVLEPVNYRNAIDEVKKIRCKFIQPISCAGKFAAD